MTPAERARQIDAEEFRQDSKRALDRALAYSQQKKDERRRAFLVTIYGETGKAMPLWNTLPSGQPAQPNTRPEPAQKLRFHGRNAKLHTVNGRSFTVAQWAQELGISIHTLRARSTTSGSVEAAILQGGNRRCVGGDLITFDGQSLPMREWADRLGINYAALFARAKRHGFETAIKMGGPQHGGPRPRPANDNAPGVVSDFVPVEGTGAGAVLQETPNITFSDKARP
jgi:hypothetical protein